MVLTTPATASEPYSAAAPSRSTSMRCTAPSGIWVMLDERRGNTSAEIGCDAMRRPLSNTRALLATMANGTTEAASARAAMWQRHGSRVAKQRYSVIWHYQSKHADNSHVT